MFATANGTSNEENEPPASPSATSGVEEAMGALTLLPGTPPPTLGWISKGKTPRTTKKTKSYKE